VRRVVRGTLDAAAATGDALSDAAQLTGGSDPTGTITFTLYGPDDSTCSTPISEGRGLGRRGLRAPRRDRVARSGPHRHRQRNGAWSKVHSGRRRSRVLEHRPDLL